MAQCSNCKTSLSCGCQKRKASDGAAVCNNCISRYEAGVKGMKAPNKEAQPVRKDYKVHRGK
jgi:hypothetical protein